MPIIQEMILEGQREHDSGPLIKRKSPTRDCLGREIIIGTMNEPYPKSIFAVYRLDYVRTC